MNNKTENLNPVQISRSEEENAAGSAEAAKIRRPFVEPEVSFPINVLEATTFFQGTDSGAAPLPTPTPPLP